MWVLRDADEPLRGSYDRPSGARRLLSLNLRFLLERVLRHIAIRVYCTTSVPDTGCHPETIGRLCIRILSGAPYRSLIWKLFFLPVITTSLLFSFRCALAQFTVLCELEAHSRFRWT